MRGNTTTSVKRRISSALEGFEDLMYGILGVLLICVGILALWAAAHSLISAISQGDIVTGVVDVIDKVLLALMIAEILYTVTLSFRSHALQPGPFLVVGLIAAVRRVLLISLEAAHPSAIESAIFRNYMIELGLLGFLIAVFVFSLWVLGKKSDSPDTD